MKLLLATLFGLTVATTLATPANALTCAVEDPISGQCYSWTFDNLPTGFVNCAGNTNVYPGHILLFTGPNYTGYCFRRVVPAGQNYTNYTLGDLDTNEFKVRSIKSYLARGATIYDGTNLSGTILPLAAYGANWPNFTTWYPSSLVTRN